MKSIKFNAILAALSSTAILLTGGPAAAQTAPIIAGYGAAPAVENLANAPDPQLRYKVVFEVTRDGGEDAAVNPGLDRVARFINLLARSGVRPAPGDVVVVIHGAATSAVYSAETHRDQFNRENPNAALIAALQAAGVDVHVCGIALANRKVEPSQVLPGVSVDVAAMITLANLQLRGWVLLEG